MADSLADGQSFRVLERAATAGDSMREFGIQVLVGLSERPKSLPSRYIYDDRGSKLFARIMELPEYYPTNCEQEILEAHSGSIAELVAGTPINLVELGAGDGKKTTVLMQGLVDGGVDFEFVPIDISEQAMYLLQETMQQELPDVAMRGLVAEYADGIHWLGSQASQRRNLVLFLGSNIGNFSKAATRAFLRRLWNELNDGDFVLIGFDLKKDIDILLRAYNDFEGVTAEFNINLLERINRELGGTFEKERFRHYGTYNVFSGAMESYLVSLEHQEVAIAELGHTFEFEPWEPVHVEYSYKYLPSDITSLAADTGFSVVNQFSDRREYFVDSLWRVDKPDLAEVQAVKKEDGR